MPPNSSSTCANNDSVKNAGTPADTESANNNLPTSSSTSSTSISATAAADDSNYTAERIAAYTTNPTNPNPSYTNSSAEASVAQHIAGVTSVIDDFDVVMNKVGQNNVEDDGK